MFVMIRYVERSSSIHDGMDDEGAVQVDTHMVGNFGFPDRLFFFSCSGNHVTSRRRHRGRSGQATGNRADSSHTSP